MENWVLAPVGFIIAMFSSLVGIGGGLLWAPFFILIKGFDFRVAIFFSFTVQILGMGSASLSNFRMKKINWRMCMGLLPIVAIGVIIGGIMKQLIPNPKILETGLGVLSIVESLFFTFQIEKYNVELSDDPTMRAPLWLKLQSSLFSVFSGVFSIGISDFIIPVFRGKLKIAMRTAIGTSIFLNFFSAVVGTSYNLAMHTYALPADTFYILMFSWIGVFIGGQIGPRLSGYINDTKMKELFIFLLLLLGIHLIYQSV